MKNMLLKMLVKDEEKRIGFPINNPNYKIPTFTNEIYPRMKFSNKQKDKEINIWGKVANSSSEHEWKSIFTTLIPESEYN